MAWIAEQLLGRRRLDDLAEIHDGDAVGDVLHHGEIVADEDVGEAKALLQLLHQVDDLRLDRHVERRHRLVGHDQARLDGQRAGDGDALALAAGEFVRIAPRMVGPQPYQLEQLRHARRSLLLVADQAMQPQRLAQHGTDSHARIERGVRVLEDDLQAAAARAHLVGVERQQVLALEAHGAFRRLDQPQHQPADGRLAAARLAHDGERLAFFDVEVDTVDGAHLGADARKGTALHREVLHQSLNVEQRFRPRIAHWKICASGARRQRERWPGATSTSGGGAERQASSTNGQRAAKRQPTGGWVMSGTRPSIEGRRSRF